jgi:hypothetical protein
MTAGDGGHYIQNLAERYKISDKRLEHFIAVCLERALVPRCDEKSATVM